MSGEKRRIGLIGLGAVGAMYAWRLLDSGAALRVIVDSARRARYAQTGIVINGSRVDFPYATPEEAEPVDLLIIATKQGGLADAMETAAPFICADTQIISLINGVTSEEQLEKRFPDAQVLYAVAQGMDAVKAGSRLSYVSPGVIVLGEREPGAISARVRGTADYLNAHGVNTLPVPDMRRRQWSKWVFNVGINQATMVFACGYGGVQQPGRAREVMIGAMREAQRLSALEGYPVGEEDFDGWLTLTDTLAPQGMTSMRQDALAGRRSEVELFAGTAIRLGQKHGVAVPVNQWLYAKIMEMEAEYP